MQFSVVVRKFVSLYPVVWSVQSWAQHEAVTARLAAGGAHTMAGSPLKDWGRGLNYALPVEEARTTLRVSLQVRVARA